MCITVDLSDPCCSPDVRNVNKNIVLYTRTAPTRATTVPVQTHDTTKHNAGTLVHRRRRRTRTVRRRHPSVLTGDCGPRLESVTCLDHMIDFRKWIFLLLFCSRFHTPDTTRGHSVYLPGYTADHKLFLRYIHWIRVYNGKRGK